MVIQTQCSARRWAPRQVLAMRLVILLIALCWLGVVSAAEPDRARGLSAHFLPKRVADADKSKAIKWGFVATTAQTAPLAPKDRPVFQSVGELLRHFKGLPTETQRNGIWVVTTNPAAYSPEEAAMLEELKRECKARSVALFVARGSELPHGWQRYSRYALPSNT